MDILPTFLDFAETDHPGAAYRGRSILPMKGKSLAATLKAPEKTVHDEAAYVGWELYGHRALRQGDWKIVWDAAKGDDAAWELYNIADDPQEQNNLSGNEPERDDLSLGDLPRRKRAEAVILRKEFAGKNGGEKQNTLGGVT